MEDDDVAYCAVDALADWEEEQHSGDLLGTLTLQGREVRIRLWWDDGEDGDPCWCYQEDGVLQGPLDGEIEQDDEEGAMLQVLREVMGDGAFSAACREAGFDPDTGR